MTKKFIKDLADLSYSKYNLDKEKTLRFAKSLKRKDLKIFIKGLKAIEAKNTVRIYVADDSGLAEKRRVFSKIYPEKKIVFVADPSLLTGIRIEEFDNIYELSLRDILEHSVRKTTND